MAKYCGDIPCVKQNGILCLLCICRDCLDSVNVNLWRKAEWKSLFHMLGKNTEKGDIYP